jgi:hypothetical protein
MITHTFFLCNKEKEPLRYESLTEQIHHSKITDYSFFTYIWSNEITPEIRAMYCKTDTCMRYHGRNMITNPLLNTEISLFLNHIQCLRHIKQNYTNGCFAIFESDVLFYEYYNVKINTIMTQAIDKNNVHIINIGEGNRDILPCSEPLRAGLHIYKEKTNKFTEGIIWTYEGICTFLDHFDKTSDIDGPIDTRIHIFSEIYGSFNIYWAYPPLVYQGSISGKFNSIIR